MAGPNRLIGRYEFPDGLWYHPQEHLWLSPAEPDPQGRRLVTVGLDALGVEALGEVVYVQLSEPGQRVGAGQALGSLEAEKMVRPLLAPVSGVLVEVNGDLRAAPRLLNTEPYGRGWMVRVAAEAWEAESRGLLRAAADVERWVREELAAYEERA